MYSSGGTPTYFLNSYKMEREFLKFLSFCGCCLALWAVWSIQPVFDRITIGFDGGATKSAPASASAKMGFISDAAPSTDIAETEASEYIARFSRIAQTEMQKFGIPASISLAQGLVESRAGNSTLARRNNNHFGIKCFSKKCKKGHCANFTDDTHKDFFRIYRNAWESWRAHSEVLASGRFAGLTRHGMDWRAWAAGLQSLGYATDRTYAEKLTAVIVRYELYRFDK